MRFFRLALAFAGTLAAVGYAAPAATSSQDVSGNNANTDATMIECGWFLKIEEEGTMPLYSNGHYENLELFTHMIGMFVEKCGICMAFSGRDAQGAALWFGGPGSNSEDKVRGAQSYYCVFGKSPAEEAEIIANLRARNTVGVEAAKLIRTIDTRDTQVTCGRYETFSSIQGPYEMVADGFWHNLPLGETMKNVRIEAPCGICMMFRDRNAQGDMMWSGGPGQIAGEKVKGAQSYYCLNRKESKEMRIIHAHGNNSEDKPAKMIRTVDARDNTPSPSALVCGWYYNDLQQGPFDMVADGFWHNLDESRGMTSVRVYDPCGICMVFKDRNAQGDIVWSGGPGQIAGLQVKGAQSYYCYYRKAEDQGKVSATTVAPVLPREDPIPASSTTISTILILPNPTIPPRAPQFPCGSLGTVDKDGNVGQLPTWSDQQYYVPNGSVITWFDNVYCSLCGVFDSREADANLLWNDGPGKNVTVKGGHSYFCYGL